MEVLFFIPTFLTFSGEAIDACTLYGFPFNVYSF